MPQGNQLLAIVELRNILEKWAMSPELANDSPYILTEFRRDLREYFLPQQWRGTKKPTPRGMFKCALELRDGGRGMKSFLGEMTWLLKASYSGDIKAQTSVGYYFAELRDCRRYLFWTKQAARGGSRDSFRALFNLGSSYSMGEDGVRRHYGTALKYFMKAYKLGHEDAMTEIGRCYMRLRHYGKAKLWLERAVSQRDDAFAYSHLGEMYEKGLGVRKSRAIALGYYLTAGDMGHEFAQGAAQRLRCKPLLFAAN